MNAGRIPMSLFSVGEEVVSESARISRWSRVDQISCDDVMVVVLVWKGGLGWYYCWIVLCCVTLTERERKEE